MPTARVIRYDSNSQAQDKVTSEYQSLRQRILQRALNYQPPALPEAEESNDTLSQLDLVLNKYSNHFYEVSESDRREIDLIRQFTGDYEQADCLAN